MALNILATGAFLGATAVVLGAFGAHLLKKRLPPEKLESWETGVKYQLAHALLLLVLGLDKSTNWQAAAWCLFAGVILFSGSIYLLALRQPGSTKLRFLGPVTPLGGLFLIAGWAFIIYSALVR